MSTDGVNSSKPLPFSTGSPASKKFDHTIVAKAFKPKIFPSAKVSTSNVEFSAPLFNGSFKAQRSDPSSNIWYWGYTGQDVKGNPVNLAGQVTLKGKFTDKELLEGSILKKKIIAARGAAKYSVKALSASPFKQPKLSLPPPSYTQAPSALGGLKLGTPGPYASSYTPASRISLASPEQVYAEKLLKGLKGALKEFLTEPAATRKKLNNITAQVNTLVCGIGAQKVSASTVQSLSAMLVDAQSKLNPKLAAHDQFAVGMIHGISAPFKWGGEQIVSAKIPIISEISGAFVNQLNKEEKDYIVQGYKPDSIQAKSGKAFGESLSATVGILVGTEVVTVAFAAAGTAGEGVIAASAINGAKGIALSPKAMAAVNSVKTFFQPATNLATKGMKLVTNPDVQQKIFYAFVVQKGGQMIFHSAKGDIVELSRDIGSLPTNLKDFLSLVKLIKASSKTVQFAAEAQRINKKILDYFSKLPKDKVAETIKWVNACTISKLEEFGNSFLQALKKGLEKYKTIAGAAEALRKLGKSPSNGLTGKTPDPKIKERKR